MKIYLPATIALATILSACSSSETPTFELSLDEAQVNQVYQLAESLSVEEVLGDANAMEVATWLFSENCSTCHQADATGKMGVPDLTDSFWLFEGTEESIKHSISQGRVGLMPRFSDLIGEVELGLLVSYVESLASSEEQGSSEASGKEIYDEHCVICHAADGTGLANLGPNLTDDHWQWGDNMITIRQSIANGRTAECPSQESVLSDAQIHLLTAYVMSLSAS